MGQGESTSASKVEDACIEHCKVCMIMKEAITKLDGSLERREEKFKRADEEIRSLGKMLREKDVQLKSSDQYLNEGCTNTRCRC